MSSRNRDCRPWSYRRSRADLRMVFGASLITWITFSQWDSPTAQVIVGGAFVLLGVEGVSYMYGALKDDHTPNKE
jgi:hypothetical protein